MSYLLGTLYFVLVLSLFGFLGLQRRERHLIETQLRLDRCVEKTALDLNRKLNQIENLNRQVKMTRTALLADLEPSSREVLTAKLIKDAFEQDVLLTLWKKNQMEWLVKQGCESKADLAQPLPLLFFSRTYDALGPRPLSWPRAREKSLVLRLNHPPKHAAIKVYGEKNVPLYWQAKWLPSNSLRTSLD